MPDRQQVVDVVEALGESQLFGALLDDELAALVRRGRSLSGGSDLPVNCRHLNADIGRLAAQKPVAPCSPSPIPETVPIRRYRGYSNPAWRVDETCIRVKGEWKWLFRAIDREGRFRRGLRES